MSNKKTILAIDDDVDMLAFYQVALADLGDVELADGLVQARPLLADTSLILLDFHLQNDEEKFQDTVRELKQFAPVLLCSGIQDERVPILGATLGIAGYWNKASGVDALRQLVQQTLFALG